MTTAVANNPASAPTSSSSPASPGPADYMHYERLLREAWRDLPDLTVEYRDMGYTRPVPVTSTAIETIASHLTGLVNVLKPAATQPLRQLHACSGLVEPGTMTLVLAPPGHGKSTLLKALAGRFCDDSNLRGLLLYNGLTAQQARERGLHLNRMTAYVEQTDVHMPLLTVRETFQFALDNAVADPALLQQPEVAALHAKKVDLVLELLGLKECAETIIGNEMLRGVSGGQKRRVSIGEMLLTNARLLLLDEITTGLDSAASFDILGAVRQWTRLMRGSCVAALLQPTPECFALFDRLILLRQGAVVYDGPIDRVQAYLSSIGVHVPDDQDLADFLTDFLNDPKLIFMRSLYRRMRKLESSRSPAADADAAMVAAAGTSVADGAAAAPADGADSAAAAPASTISLDSSPPTAPTHAVTPAPHVERAPSDFHLSASTFVVKATNATLVNAVPLTTSALTAAFKSSPFHADIQARLQHIEGNRSALATAVSPSTFSAYSLAQFASASSYPFLHHLASNFTRQWRNLARNDGMYVPRLFNSVFIGLVLGSVFYQLESSNYFARLGLCIFACVHLAFVNQVEMPFSSEAKLVIFKQVDAGFFPVSAYSLSGIVVHLVLATTETFLFTIILYWMSGFDPDAGRYFFFTLVLLAVNLCMSTLFRLVTYMARYQEMAEQLAIPTTVVCLVFGGFLITRNNIKDFFIWMYWLSPFSWAFNSLAQNEYYSPRYADLSYLRAWSIPTDSAYKWAGIGYLLGLFVVFGVLSTLALAYKRFPLSVGTSRNLADEEADEQANSRPDEQVHLGQPVPTDVLRRYASSYRAKNNSSALPFEPIDLAWRDIKYTVKVKSEDGKSTVDRVLLNGINGYARAGTLTALMGSSGAGKTTLMDVIAGRKTAGKMDGEILINGFPTPPSVFQRVMGYVEQTDIHLPTQTVREALRFSARLRLPRNVTDEQMNAFVEEVIEILELTPLADRLIGNATIAGLSPGQLKRVTIGVELVSNPPLLFLDEPTSGLDSRSALIVMRVVKRIAQTGRAVVCTIHQPSAELFYMFDRLLLLKSGGIETFFGDLGEFGANLVDYFESAPVAEDFRVKLPPRTNPASWMLDVIGAGTGAKLKAKGYTKADLPDFATIYAQSKLREENMAVLQQVCTPKPGARAMALTTKYAADTWTQYRLVVARLFQFYWRNTKWTMTRFYIMLTLSVLFGLLYLDVGQSSQSAIVSKIAAISLALGIPGTVVCESSMPMLSRQRAVFYREQSSIMYSAYTYALALTIVELVYTPLAAFVYVVPQYFLVGYESNAGQFFKFYLVLMLVMLIFSFLGQFLIAALADPMAAMLAEALVSTFVVLFSGVFIKPGSIPAGWKWVYWMNPVPKGMIAIGTEQFVCNNNDGDIGCRSIDVVDVGSERLDAFVSDYLDSGFGMYWKMIGWLVLTMVVMRLFADVAIAKVNHLKR